MQPHEMSLQEHLVALRSVVVRCLGAYFLCFLLCIFFADSLQFVLQENSPAKLIATNPLEIFFNQINISLFIAFLLSLPVMIVFMIQFILPGLHDHEKRMVIPFLTISIFMFYLGVYCGYKVMIPKALNYLTSMNSEINFMPKVSEMFQFIKRFILAIGLCFQLPVLLIFGLLTGLIPQQSLISHWRYFILGIVFICALVTPPDAISMLMIMLPLIVIYGVLVIIIWLKGK